MKNISLIISSLVLSSTIAIAESNSIIKAFTQGTVSGDVSLYTQSINKNDKKNDFTSGSIGLNYQTDKSRFLMASLGVRAQNEFSKRDDETSEYENNAIVNVAALQTVFLSRTSYLSIGRQEIDLQWLSDYNESTIISIPTSDGTIFSFVYTKRKAEIDIDIIEDFAKPNGIEKGLYVYEVTNISSDSKHNTEGKMSFYLYYLPDVAKFYGGNVSIDGKMFGLTIHGTRIKEKGMPDDGWIINLEGRYKVQKISLAGGYVRTDPLGVGSLTAYGDNINPFEDGNNIYNSDVEAFYVSIGYEIARLELDALYGITKYGSNENDESELNLSISYSFTKKLSFSGMYVNYTDESIVNNDYEKLFARMSYSF